MTLLTNSELKTHIETDLPDAALQRLADAAEKMIDEEAGTVAAVIENFNAWGFPSGRDQRIFVARQISSIASVNERDHPDDTAVTLSTDDYRVENSRMLIRLQEGTNPRLRWAQMMEIAYTPEPQTEIRERVQIDLVKLGIQFSGAKRETIGDDFEFWHLDQKEGLSGALRPLRNTSNRMLFV